MLSLGGTKLLNFDKFTQAIDKKKVEEVTNNSGKSYIYFLALEKLEVDRIDFSAFSLEDTTYVYTRIEESLTYEDEDGVLFVDPNHHFGEVINLIHKIDALEEAPRERVPSSFRFI